MSDLRYVFLSISFPSLNIEVDQIFFFCPSYLLAIERILFRLG